MGSINPSLLEQPELALAREPVRADVPINIIRAQKTAAAAFTLACSASGLEDKEIYLPLELDAGYFSNMKKGKATLQADMVASFCARVGNSIYPEWLAYQLGCTLVMIRTEAERRIEALESQLAHERERRQWAEEMALGRRAA